MATYDERLAALEKTTTTLRAQLTQALNKIEQLEQHEDDSNHQQTILLGIASGQEKSIRIIKEDVSVLKEDVSVLKEDVQGIKGRLDEHTSLLTQILARLPEKP